MKIHPVGQCFPMLPQSELNAMAESIRNEGQLNPCVRQGDMLLDGRNRIEACKIAGVEPKFVEYTGESPVAFIVAVNLERRHLEKGQKIALALELEPHFAKEAKKRQREHGGTAPGRKTLVANVPQVKSRDKAASAVGVSGKLVTAAKAIKKADPERFEKVKQGKMSIARAKKEIKAEQDKEALAEAQKNVDAEKRRKIESVCDLRVCSCSEQLDSVRPYATGQGESTARRVS